MKLKEIIRNTKARFRDAGIESYAIDADVIIAEAIDKNREFLIGNPEYEVAQEQLEKIEGFCNRRENREPVAKILGRKEFWSMEFAVDKNTLDPRPDSETLIEAVLGIYQDKAADLRILDLGTGSGCLLLVLLSEYKNAYGMGVDINSGAINKAKENSFKLNLARCSDFVVSNWVEKVDGDFDLVIGNPPYIKESDIDSLEPEVSKYDPYIALAGGENGLSCYEEIAKNMPLKSGGYAVFEFGLGQGEDVKNIFCNAGMQFVSFKKDLSGIDRCIVFKI